VRETPRPTDVMEVSSEPKLVVIQLAEVREGAYARWLRVRRRRGRGLGRSSWPGACGASRFHCSHLSALEVRVDHGEGELLFWPYWAGVKRKHSEQLLSDCLLSV